MSAFTKTAFSKFSLAFLAVCFAAPLMSAGVAQAADCQEDFQKLIKRRDALTAQLSAMTKGKKKQLDPSAACPKFRALTSVMGEAVAYLKKNKDWCSIPDNIVQGAEAQRGQFSKYAVQACGYAAKKAAFERQQRAAAAANGGMGAPQAPRLPTGPL